MTDRPRLLSGLMARRHDLVNEISAAEALLRQHYETLRSLDHLIRLEDEDAQLPPVPTATRVRRKIASTLVRGDVSRLCLDALREATGETMTTREVVDYIVRKRTLTFESRRQADDFSSSVAMALARHAKRGLLDKVATGPNRQGQWRLEPI